MLSKKECEICGCLDKEALHFHHIIPRPDPRSTNDPSNLACICANCHSLVHAGQIIIEGRYGTTFGNTLFHHRFGEKHIIRPGIHLNTDGTAHIVD